VSDDHHPARTGPLHSVLQAPRCSKLYYPAVPKVRVWLKSQTVKCTRVFSKYMLSKGECHANRFVKLRSERQAIASEDAAFLQSIVVIWYQRWDLSFHSLLPISTSKTRTREILAYAWLHSPLFETSYAPTDNDVLHNVR
jgi:hypothetical protein